VRLDGGLSCWGEDGLRERMSVASLDDVVSVSIADLTVGASHSCVLHKAGTVRGSMTQRRSPPVWVVPVPCTSVATCRAGGRTTCLANRTTIRRLRVCGRSESPASQMRSPLPSPWGVGARAGMLA
jgi:hypothetical protein